MSESGKKNNKKIKTMANIGPCECRWPFGDPREPDFHFCGAQQAPGRPYCAEHWAMSMDSLKVRSHAVRPSLITRRAA